MAPLSDEPGFGRSTFVKVAGTASLFAGGVALGVGVSGGLGAEKVMSIPEVSILCSEYNSSAGEKKDKQFMQIPLKEIEYLCIATTSHEYDLFFVFEG